MLDQRLSQQHYVGGDRYSIADMAIYPWIVPWEKQRQTLEEFPDLERWFEEVSQRPAVRKAYSLVEDVNPQAGVTMDAEARKHLFGNR